MKKVLFNMFLVTFVIVAFTAQSWAFGSRHHDDGLNNQGQGFSSFTGNSGNGTNSFGQDFGSGKNGSGDNGSGDNGSGNNGLGNNGSGNSGSGSNGSGSGDGFNGNHSGFDHHFGGGNNNFPTAPVPEPMTLSLLGTGLAGILLKRKV